VRPIHRPAVWKDCRRDWPRRIDSTKHATLRSSRARGMGSPSRRAAACCGGIALSDLGRLLFRPTRLSSGDEGSRRRARNAGPRSREPSSCPYPFGACDMSRSEPSPAPTGSQWHRTSAGGRPLSKHIAEFIRRHPGCAHPVSDRWAVSIVAAAVVLLRAGESTLISEYLVWITSGSPIDTTEPRRSRIANRCPTGRGDYLLGRGLTRSVEAGARVHVNDHS
jgi:hypothetical protein